MIPAVTTTFSSHALTNSKSVPKIAGKKIAIAAAAVLGVAILVGGACYIKARRSKRHLTRDVPTIEKTRCMEKILKTAVVEGNIDTAKLIIMSDMHSCPKMPLYRRSVFDYVQKYNNQQFAEAPVSILCEGLLSEEHFAVDTRSSDDVKIFRAKTQRFGIPFQPNEIQCQKFNVSGVENLEVHTKTTRIVKRCLELDRQKHNQSIPSHDSEELLESTKKAWEEFSDINHQRDVMMCDAVKKACERSGRVYVTIGALHCLEMQKMARRNKIPYASVSFKFKESTSEATHEYYKTLFT